MAPGCSLINADLYLYFLKPDETSDVFTIKEIFKQLASKIPKAFSKSPTIFPGLCPYFPPWLALPPVICPSPLLSVLTTNSVGEPAEAQKSLLQLWEIVFYFLFYHPLDPSVQKFPSKPVTLIAVLLTHSKYQIGSPDS